MRDLARSGPDGLLHFPENCLCRRLFIVKRLPVESDSLGFIRRILKIHEQTQSLPSRDAQRLEEIVLAIVSRFWISASKLISSRLALLLGCLDITPELAAGIAVKHYDCVRLRQPDQNLCLKNGKC